MSNIAKNNIKLLIILWNNLFYNKEKDNIDYLHIVNEFHPDMMNIYQDIGDVAVKNYNAAISYMLPIYRYYYGLFSKQIISILENIFFQNNYSDIQVSIYIFFSLWQI